MALPILTKTDFTGQVRISLNNYSSLEAYITQLEPVILNEVLNADCLYEIETDVTLKSKYDDLLNGGYYFDEDGDRVRFRGLKEFLKYYVYANYLKDDFASSISGLVKSLNENSVKLTGGEQSQYIYDRYNEAIAMYQCEIYPYLYFYREIEQTATGSTQVLTTYTINVPSTEYLYDNDKVTINGVEYTVSNVVTDTSFDITESESGLDFTDAEIIWKPYFEIEEKHYTKGWL